MTNKLERRVASTIYRVLASTDEDSQHRALDRLQSLAGMEIAVGAWLATNPDPEVADQVLHHLLAVSPMRPMCREVNHA